MLVSSQRGRLQFEDYEFIVVCRKLHNRQVECSQYIGKDNLLLHDTWSQGTQPMNGENRLLVSDEPTTFEEYPVQIQDL